MTDANEKSNEGFGIRLTFMNVLFLIFLTLKLTDVITWSWWWVTAPLWGPFAVVTVFIAVAAIGLIIAELFDRATK